MDTDHGAHIASYSPDPEALPSDHTSARGITANMLKSTGPLIFHKLVVEAGTSKHSAASQPGIA